MVSPQDAGGVDPGLFFVEYAVVVAVAAVVLAVSLWVSHRHHNKARPVHDDPQSPRSGRRAWPVGSNATIRLRLVAVDALADAFVLDGVVVDEGSPLGPVGWPVAVGLERPEGAPLDEALRAILTRWVVEDAVVHLISNGADPTRRASISDGTSTVTLGLHRLGRQRWAA